MSCSLVAIPWALMWVVGAVINEAAQKSSESNNLSIHQEDYLTNRYSVSAENIVEHEFETPFTDKEILIKTLEEHGVIGIEELNNGEITGKVDTFSLQFSKPSAELPYKLKISCRENDSAEEKVNDVSSEYALNVQEAAYLSIVEKLKENNMQIEEESVEDDNTIVLTINLE